MPKTALALDRRFVIHSLTRWIVRQARIAVRIMTRKTPEIIEVNSQQMESLLDRAASNTLREEDTELMRQIFDSYVQVFQIVGDKNTTIARLRKLLFGASSEKTEKVLGDEKGEQEPNTACSDADSEHTDPNDSAATGE